MITAREEKVHTYVLFPMHSINENLSFDFLKVTALDHEKIPGSKAMLNSFINRVWAQHAPYRLFYEASKFIAS